MFHSQKLKNALHIPACLNRKTFRPVNLINRTRVVSDYVQKKSVSKSMPTVVELEVTSRCNLNCIMCPRDKVKNKQDMTWETFTKSVDETCDLCELYILHASGEPLLNSRIIEMINYCASKGVGTWLSTNAMVLDEKMAKKLISSKLDGLVIAIDGATAQTHEKIRVGAVYDKVVNNTLQFLEHKAAARKGPMVTLQFVKMPQNSHEVDSFVSKWSNKDVNILIKPVVNWFAKDEEDLLYPDVSCDRPYYWMTVKSDGSVPVCADDVGIDYRVGNINNSSAEELWNSSVMCDFRGKAVKGKKHHELCAKCDYTPSRPLNPIGLAGLAALDMLSIVKILFWLGYKRPESPKGA